MTTYVHFDDETQLTSQFTLDGSSYNALTVWNVVSQRWYVQLSDSLGDVVFYGPLIGSPLDADIPLAPWLFTASTLVYRADSGNFEITP
jgi:hypothetical protein